MLNAKGIETIIASDFSPGRRAPATACGATMVLDPAVDSPYQDFGERGFATSIAERAAVGLTAMKDLRKSPLPWHITFGILKHVGVTSPKRPIVFECVGAPGIIDGVIIDVPLNTHVVVAGVCMKPDQLRPVMAINKEIDLRFVVGMTRWNSPMPCRCLPTAGSTPRPWLNGPSDLKVSPMRSTS